MRTAIILVCAALWISACKSESDGTASQTTAADAASAADIIKSESEGGIAIGTDIKGLMKEAETPAPKKGGFQLLSWDDLIPADYDVESIMAKYQSKILLTTEGSREEIAVYKLMQEEFNQAPPNQSLNKKTVKIPGFVAPLEEVNGMVGEFLLVPYFGACVHAPPPPVNQTIVVNPQKGMNVEMSAIRHPVWVVGEINVERSSTDLAEAGYRIDNARIERYLKN